MNERSVYSQQGEDGIIEFIFDVIGTSSRFAVEFGAFDGVTTSNTKLLEEKGWRRLLLDGEPAAEGIHAEVVTGDNITELFDKYGVPRDVDLVSIDTDFKDWWIWRGLNRRYRPRLVVVEYNGSVPPDLALTVPEDAPGGWDGTDYFGASLLAFDKLARVKGYRLVYCEGCGVNAFFVRSDLIKEPLVARTVKEAWKPANYYGSGKGHPPSDKQMVEVREEWL